MLKLAAVVGMCAAGACAQCTPQWATSFSQDGPSDTVNAATEFDPDGPGPLPPAVVIGGDFEYVGGARVNHVAMWDGQSWRTMGAGFNGSVNVLAVLDPDGPGPAVTSLYAGGTFTGCIARWDGQAWVTVGSGVSDIVLCMAVFDDDGAGPNPPMLCVGGRLGAFSNAARFNGVSWQALGAGLNDFVYALTTFDEDGPGPLPAALFAGGDFTASGATPALHAAKWNGSAWSALGDGFNGSVYSFAAFDFDGAGPGLPALCAGGQYQMSGAAACNSIARWTGAAWSQVAAGLSGDVRALVVTDDDGPGPRPESLCAFGAIRTVAPSNASCALRLDGNTWVSMGLGLSTRVFCACTWDADGAGTGPSRIVAGGFFNTVYQANPPIFTPKLAQWDGAAWGPVGPAGNRGPDEMVWALASFDEDGAGPLPPALFAAGDFRTAGGVGAKYIARWNGNTWSAVGGGLNSRAQALLVFDEDGAGPGAAALYVGGYFSTAGGASANQVAKWDGSHWSALGSGPQMFVKALAAADLDGPGPNPSRLYAGGSVLSPGQPAVSVWSGTTWSALAGLTGSLDALIEFDADGPGPSNPVLVAGGVLTVAGQPVRVAAWNGQQWSALGTLPGYEAESLAVFDEDGAGPNPARLFAGGYITNTIKRWDGVSWTDVGGGFGGSDVYALTVFDEDGAGPAAPALYAGGWFFYTHAPPFPSVTVTRIAKWSGSTWSALGSGMSYDVRALAVCDEDGDGPRTPGLYAGGRFTIAGGMSSNFIARWGCGDLPICYPNCDGSTLAPVINVADFICFMNRYAAGDPYANCDHSTAPPTVNVADFICFMNSAAAGCP